MNIRINQWIKLLPLSCLCLLSCQENKQQSKVDPYEHIQDQKAQEIIRRSVNDAGGLERWQSIKNISYKKDFLLYDANGDIEKTYKQAHNYDFKKNDIIIRSEENKDLIYTTFVDSVFSRNKNGEDLNIDSETISKAINSSIYVIGIPFKLLDPGADIKYLGEERLNDELLDVIEVSYNPTLFKNHSSENIWKYYFEKKNSRIVANWVASSDHYNIIENLGFTRENGILFHKQRKSYRLSEIGEKLYLRAEYSYYDYQLNSD